MDCMHNTNQGLASLRFLHVGVLLGRRLGFRNPSKENGNKVHEQGKKEKHGDHMNPNSIGRKRGRIKLTRQYISEILLFAFYPSPSMNPKPTKVLPVAQKETSQLPSCSQLDPYICFRVSSLKRGSLQKGLFLVFALITEGRGKRNDSQGVSYRFFSYTEVTKRELGA